MQNNGLTFDRIKNYKIPDSQMKEFFTKDQRNNNSTNNFPRENQKEFKIFPIYKNLVENPDLDLNDYIKMLWIIIQKKPYKINLDIKIKFNTSKMIIRINENDMIFLNKNIVQETKNLFCLNLLIKNYPFFCKTLYYYIHEILNLNIKYEISVLNDKQIFSEIKSNVSIHKVKNIFDSKDKDFFAILINFVKSIISCKVKEKKMIIEYNPIIEEVINNYHFKEKTLIQILEEVLFIKLNKVLSQTILIEDKKIKIFGNLKNSKFSYIYTLSCTNKDFAENYIALILIKKFIPNLYKNMVNYYNKLIFWEILEKFKNYQGGMSSFKIDGNIKEFKNIILQKKFFEKENFIFGHDSNFKILSEFFKSNGFNIKIILENDEVSNINYIIDYNKKSISFNFQFENKNILDIFKISEAKLIQMIFSPEIFKNFIKKFIFENLKQFIFQKNTKIFFSQFKSQILEKKIPEKEFINSDEKISSLEEDYDLKENDLQGISMEIGSIYDTEINFEFIEIEGEKDKKDAFIYTKNDKKNGYFFRISFIDEELAIDYTILKFLELEFNDLFKWILIQKYEIFLN